MLLDLLNADGIHVCLQGMSMTNPTGELVDRISDLCKEENIQVLIGLGGGSVLDCAKAVSATVYAGGTCRSWMVGKLKINRALPVIAIPTTAATGSEVNCGGLISFPEYREKMSFGNPLLYPKAAFVVPEFTVTQSKQQSAAGCADVLFHIMEGNYFTRGAKTEVHLCIMEELMKNLVANARIIIDDPLNIDARTNLSIIASWAMNGFLENGTGRIPACHAMEHQISGYYEDIPHAPAMAVIVPKWLRYIESKGIRQEIARFGERVFSLKEAENPYANAIKAIQLLEHFLYDELQLPSDFQTSGVNADYFEEMSDRICRGREITGIYNLKAEDFLAIYRSCY